MINNSEQRFGKLTLQKSYAYSVHNGECMEKNTTLFKQKILLSVALTLYTIPYATSPSV